MSKKYISSKTNIVSKKYFSKMYLHSKKNSSSNHHHQIRRQRVTELLLRRTQTITATKTEGVKYTAFSFVSWAARPVHGH